MECLSAMTVALLLVVDNQVSYCALVLTAGLAAEHLTTTHALHTETEKGNVTGTLSGITAISPKLRLLLRCSFTHSLCCQRVVCAGILAPCNKHICFIATPAMYASFTLQIPSKTETPKERLKRMMAAQINKQVAKDSVKSAQKIAHEEKERKARVQIERMQYTGSRRSPSPDRYRSVVSCLDGLKMYGHSGALPQAESRAGSSPKHHQPLKHILSPVTCLPIPVILRTEKLVGVVWSLWSVCGH